MKNIKNIAAKVGNVESGVRALRELAAVGITMLIM